MIPEPGTPCALGMDSTQLRACPGHLPGDTPSPYLSPVDIVQHKVELFGRLEGVAQAHKEGVPHVLQEHAALCHDVALLWSHTDRNPRHNLPQPLLPWHSPHVLAGGVELPRTFSCPCSTHCGSLLPSEAGPGSLPSGQDSAWSASSPANPCGCSSSPWTRIPCPPPAGDKQSIYDSCINESTVMPLFMLFLLLGHPLSSPSESYLQGQLQGHLFHKDLLHPPLQCLC